MPYADGTPAVSTLVDPAYRGWVEQNVTHAIASVRPTLAAPPSDAPGIRHVAFAEQLHENFPYHRCACLIAQWSVIAQQLATDNAGVGAILRLLSGWDAIILILDGESEAALIAVMASHLAPRIGLAHLRSSGASLIPAVIRTITAVRTLPPARVPLDADMVARIETLSEPVRTYVYEAVRSPSEWNVKRLHSACRLTRRSLERTLTRAELPSPAVLLGGATAPTADEVEQRLVNVL